MGVTVAKLVSEVAKSVSEKLSEGRTDIKLYAIINKQRGYMDAARHRLAAEGLIRRLPHSPRHPRPLQRPESVVHLGRNNVNSVTLYPTRESARLAKIDGEQTVIAVYVDSGWATVHTDYGTDALCSVNGLRIKSWRSQ